MSASMTRHVAATGPRITKSLGESGERKVLLRAVEFGAVVALGNPLGEKLCRVLSLDRGGAKGFHTLGTLKEIEGIIGSDVVLM
jgi:hypothetical protein